MSRQLPHRDSTNLSTRQVSLSTRHIDLSTRQKFFWAQTKQSVVDIFRKPIDNFEQLIERAKTRNRQSQTTNGNLPFKIFSQDEKWSLVQLVDRTFGWLPSSALERVKSYNYWEKIKLAPHEKLTEISTLSQSEIRKILSKFKDTPYLWGGTTSQGMDCSAFVQKSIFAIGDILLPRNSREQKKCGELVYLLSTGQPDLSTHCLLDTASCPLDSSTCPLDTLFFVHSTSGQHHTGVYFENLVWHFCLDRKGLTFEPLSEMKKRYNHVETRRLFKFKNA